MLSGGSEFRVGAVNTDKGGGRADSTRTQGAR